VLRPPLLASVVLALFAGTALAGDVAYRSRHHFSFRVPEGWQRMEQDTLREAAGLTASVLGMKVPSYEAAFERTDAETPFEYPYVLVQFVEGSTSGAYRDLEEKLMEGVEEVDAEHGAKLGEILGEHSYDRPVVDRQKNRVWMSMRANTPDAGPVRGIMALHLGRRGVAQLTLYTLEENAAEGRRELEAMSDTVRFDDGHAFEDAGFFSGWVGKGVIGGLIGLAIGLARAGLKSRRASAARAAAALTPAPVVVSPFGRPPLKKRVPAGPLRLDPEIDG
jgi:hypothetical protein